MGRRDRETEEDAFDVFVRTHGARIIRFARTLTHETQRAQDISQNVLVKVCSRWQRVSTVEDPVAYVLRMVVNEELSWRRRLSSREIPMAAVRDLRGRDDTSAVDDADAFRRRLRDMPPRQRAVLALRYYEDLPDSEVAHLMGCTESTVRSLAAKALTRLRSETTEKQETAP